MQRRIRPISTNLIIILNALVGIRKTAHAGHHAEDVVVHGIHAEVERRCLRGLRNTGRADAIEHEGCCVDAGEVTSARRLVLLRLESERVHVDGVLVRSVVHVRQRERHRLSCYVCQGRLTELVGSYASITSSVRLDHRSSWKI